MGPFLTYDSTADLDLCFLIENEENLPASQAGI
jgi:hypothetical protein